MSASDEPLQVIAPRQARSRATMERIVATAEELLEARPFERITVAEICDQASCAPTAFYARFSDKNALLLELHDRFKARMEQVIAGLLGTERPSSVTTETLIRAGTRQLIDLYTANRNLLRGVLLADNPVMYERAADLARTLSLQIAALVLGGTAEEADSNIVRDLDFAIRCGLAVLQQTLLFGEHIVTRFAFDADELADRLSAIVMAAVPQ